MGTKTSSKHQQDLYKSYQAQGRQAANRKKKLERTLKAQPNNEQVQKALQNIKYRRHTPKAPQWSHTSKAWAQLEKAFKKAKHVVEKVSEKDMFKLRARVHGKELLWNH